MSFPCRTASTTAVAIGFDTTGFNDVTEIDVIDPKNGTKTVSWDITNSTSPIFLGSEVAAMVQSPLDPSHILFVNNDDNPGHAAEDVAAPFDGNLVKPTVYVSNIPSGDPLSSINAVRNAAGGLKRVARGCNTGASRSAPTASSTPTTTAPARSSPVR